MGVAGAALGTLISRVLECGVILGYFLFVDKRIGYRIKDFFGKCSDLFGEYFRISIPVLISDVLLAVGNNMVAIVMGHIGAAFVSANAITTVTQQLSTVFIQGCSQASCIVIGHTLGRGDRERVQMEGRSFLVMGVLIGILASLVILLLGPTIIGLYQVSDYTKELASQLMNAIAIIVVFQSANSILTKGVLRGGGDTRFLMLADILFLWVISIPFGALAGLVWHWSAFWIYVALKLDQILKAVWCVYRFGSGKWIKTINATREQQN